MSAEMSQSHGPAGPSQFITPRAHQPKQELAPVPALTEPTQPAALEVVTEEPRPVPTMGMPAFLFNVAKAFNPNAQPPQLSKKEAAQLAAQAELEERTARAKASYDEQRNLSDQCTHLIVAFIGVKGAAATTTTMVHSASIFADDTRTTLYAADFNPASGTAGARLGKEGRDTTTIQEFSRIVDDVRKDRKSVQEKLRPTRYGVRVLSADDYTNIPPEQYGTVTAKMLDVLDENCEYLMLDTPNDITTAASRAIIDKADVIVFTANVGERDSLRLLRVSMDVVRKLDYADKVTNSIVVVSNVPEGMTRDDYTKYLSKVNLNHEVTGELGQGEFNGQMLAVPYDPQIALNGEVVLEALEPATTQAYRDINIAILEQGIETKTRPSITALERSIS